MVQCVNMLVVVLLSRGKYMTGTIQQRKDLFGSQCLGISVLFPQGQNESVYFGKNIELLVLSEGRHKSSNRDKNKFLLAYFLLSVFATKISITSQIVLPVSDQVSKHEHVEPFHMQTIIWSEADRTGCLCQPMLLASSSRKSHNFI